MNLDQAFAELKANYHAQQVWLCAIFGVAGLLFGALVTLAILKL